MRRAKNVGLVLCLFTLYCVLLSQGLKANALSTLFGALAAVPLTVHVYGRVVIATMSAQRKYQESLGVCRAPSSARVEHDV